MVRSTITDHPSLKHDSYPCCLEKISVKSWPNLAEGYLAYPANTWVMDRLDCVVCKTVSTFVLNIKNNVLKMS